MLGISRLKHSVLSLMGQNKLATVLYNRLNSLFPTRYNREQALTNSVVNSCILIIAQTISTLPVHTKDPEKDGARIIDNLLKNPNPWQTGERFFSHIVNDLLTEASAFIYVMRAGTDEEKKKGKGRLLHLVPLIAKNVEIGAENGFPVYEEKLTEPYQGRQSRKYSHHEIIHLTDFLGPGVLARSRVEACWQSIDALNSANLRTKSIFDKGLNISFVGKSESTDDKILTTQVDEFNKKYNSKEGTEAGGIAILSGVEITPVKGVSPVDSQLLELRQDLTREISSMFGVPPFLAGGTGDTKYSNTTARIVSMYKLGFAPLLIVIANGFANKLGHELVWEDKNLLLGDLPSIVKMYVEGIKGRLWTPNEARSELPTPLPEIEGGDKLQSSGGGMMNENPDDEDDEDKNPTDDGGDNLPEDKSLAGKVRKLKRVK